MLRCRDVVLPRQWQFGASNSSLCQQRPAEAEQWAREAIAIDGRIPSYHLALASVLEAEGRRSEAQKERAVAASLKR